MSKKVNPYEKKSKKSFRITRKQWIAGLCVLGVIAIIVGIVFLRPAATIDPHAGHNHGPEGNDHGASTNPNAKVSYDVVANADKTYLLTVRDEKGAPLFSKDKLKGAPIKTEIDKDKGIYELGWSTADLQQSTANTYEAIYYNENTRKVSQAFYAPKGCDGVRIVYPSDDQTKIIVQDVFDKTVYFKEYTLEGAYGDAGDIIVSGAKLNADAKSALVTYRIAKDKTKTVKIPLYE